MLGVSAAPKLKVGEFVGMPWDRSPGPLRLLPRSLLVSTLQLGALILDECWWWRRGREPMPIDNVAPAKQRYARVTAIQMFPVWHALILSACDMTVWKCKVYASHLIYEHRCSLAKSVRTQHRVWLPLLMLPTLLFSIYHLSPALHSTKQCKRPQFMGISIRFETDRKCVNKEGNIKSILQLWSKFLLHPQ